MVMCERNTIPYPVRKKGPKVHIYFFKKLLRLVLFRKKNSKNQQPYVLLQNHQKESTSLMGRTVLHGYYEITCQKQVTARQALVLQEPSPIFRTVLKCAVEI